MRIDVSPFKVISVDLWDTLISDRAYIEKMEEERTKIFTEVIWNFNGKKLDWNSILETEKRNFKKAEMQGNTCFSNNRIKKVLCDNVGEVPEQVLYELITKLDKMYDEFVPEVNDELLRFIRKPENKKKKKIILSNTGFISARKTREILKRLDIYSDFDKIFLSEEEKIGKPVHLFFLKPVNFYNIESFEMLHIGDNYFLDFYAAIRAGCGGCLYNWGEKIYCDGFKH